MKQRKFGLLGLISCEKHKSLVITRVRAEYNNIYKISQNILNFKLLYPYP